MTQEQYNRALLISKQLENLERISRRLKSDMVSLDYIYYSGESLTNGAITDIFGRHDKMIREEIDAEIEKLKKEIEEL